MTVKLGDEPENALRRFQPPGDRLEKLSPGMRPAADPDHTRVFPGKSGVGFEDDRRGGLTPMKWQMIDIFG